MVPLGQEPGVGLVRHDLQVQLPVDRVAPHLPDGPADRRAAGDDDEPGRLGHTGHGVLAARGDAAAPGRRAGRRRHRRPDAGAPEQAQAQGDARRDQHGQAQDQDMPAAEPAEAPPAVADPHHPVRGPRPLPVLGRGWDRPENEA
jgi:hypothetical protein